MAIRGSLAEAGLPDVVQLLALGQKTGCLSIARAGDFGSIFFEGGRIVHASLVNRRERLGEQLLRAGAVDAADLQAALTEQAADPTRRLGELLYRRGAVTLAVLERHARTQVEEAVLELFTWTQGTFSFEPEVRVELTVPTLLLDAASLLMEGARRTDERARIASCVPGRDSVFALATDVPRTGDGAPDVETIAARGVALGDADVRVARAVDGRRDVTELAECAGVIEFEAMRALYVLVTAKLARLVGAAAPRTPRAAARLEEHRNLGVAFYKAALYDEALREFRRVLELVPEDGHARFHLALIALRGARWEDAATALGEVVALTDASAAAHHALAVAHVALGDHAAAIAALDEAARRGLGDDVRVRVVRAALQLAGGDVEAASATLGDASPEASPEIPTRAAGAPWYHFRAIAAARRGDTAAASAALEQGVAIYPHAAGLLANLAALRLRAGRHDEALRLANAALAEDPSLAPAHKTAGDAHYRAGRYDDALGCYERAIAAAPTLGPDVHLRAGNVHLRRGERAQAAEAWRRVLALEPAHVIARGNLAALEREGVA